MPKVIFIMGVSGSGKTHIGEKLAKALKLTYIDADEYHSQRNIEKMSKGIPLTDSDRLPWLNTLNTIVRKHEETGCIMGCSALKQNYRNRLARGLDKKAVWIYLKGNFDLIYQRMKARKNHFMKPEMLRSQLETLEEPVDAIQIDIEEASDLIIQKIKTKLV